MVRAPFWVVTICATLNLLAPSSLITVIKEDRGDKFSVAQMVTTQKGARTMALDAKTHQIFTVTANVTGTRQDRKIEPDSFVVLVVAQ